jgi:N-carbamoyl-L-amino-acid hydrolase
VGTVGSLRLAPNLINVIAREAVATVDLRHADEQVLAAAERRLEAFLQDLRAQGLGVETRRLARTEPVVFDPGTVRVIEQAAASLGQRIRPMTSGAGQDAQMLARICPAAMIFVPSQGGVSHNPAERTDPRHVQLGADVLLRTLLTLAEERP